MRLLAITTSFPLRSNASAGVFVRRLYEHLPSDWQINVVCPADSGRADASLEDSRLRLRPVRYAPRGWRVLAQQPGGVAAAVRGGTWRLFLAPVMLLGLWWRCLIDGRHADVLHANWAICGAVAAAASLFCRRPLVTTLRGDDVARASRSLVDSWLLRMAVDASRVVICVSEAMAVELRARFPGRAEDIHVCLNGVYPTFLGVRRSAPAPGRLRVAAVGSLIHRKGYDVLVGAIALARRRADITARIVGGGPELAFLRRRASDLGVADRIEFAGELSPSEIPGALADADVFVLSSRSEGRPNVVIEALAAGLPVISSDLPGVLDLVIPGVNGWRVAVDDAAALAAALDAACSDPDDRERRAAAARAGALSAERTWRATGACYDALFRRVIAS